MAFSSLSVIRDGLHPRRECLELPLVPTLELQKLERRAGFLIGELKLAIVVKGVDIQVGTTDFVHAIRDQCLHDAVNRVLKFMRAVLAAHLDPHVVVTP